MQLLPGVQALVRASLAFEPLQNLLQEGSHEIDIVTGSDFNGLTTFANLPYSNCFRDNGNEYDIAILGAPFDTVSKVSLSVLNCMSEKLHMETLLRTSFLLNRLLMLRYWVFEAIRL